MLNELVNELAEARQRGATLKAEAAWLQDQIAALVAQHYGKDQERINAEMADVERRIAEADTAVRQAALDAYTANGNKHPHPAVTVKVFEVLEYDKTEALTYCIRHLWTALKMDARKFEAVAKAAELDFVTRRQEPRATIATKLEVSDGA